MTFANGGVSATGAVTATAFYGDGSGLTGVTAESTDRIVSDTTSIVANDGMDSISFTTGGTERIVVDSSGNVGIGTSLPSSYGLELRKSNAFFVANTAGAHGGLRMQVNGVDRFTNAIDVSGNFLMSRFNSSGTWLDNPFVVNSNGNVGIGIASPAEKLEVAGSVKLDNNSIIFRNVKTFEPTDSLGATSWAGITIQPIAGNRDAVFRFVPTGTATASTFELFNNSSQATTSRAQFKITSSALNIGGDQAAIPINLVLSSQPKLTLGSTGNVGIGTTSPAKTLDVSGTARITSDTVVSGTVQLAGTGNEVCAAANLGTIRMNPTTGKLEICRQ